MDVKYFLLNILQFRDEKYMDLQKPLGNSCVATYNQKIVTVFICDLQLKSPFYIQSMPAREKYVLHIPPDIFFDLKENLALHYLCTI